MWTRLLVVGVCLSLSSTALLAHHSFAAEFDASKRVTLTGVITKVDWTNPHVWFYIDVKDAAGKVTNWGAEMGSPNALVRQGWTHNTMRIGMIVTVPNAALAKDGSNRINAGSVQVDGKRLGAASSEAPPIR